MHRPLALLLTLLLLLLSMGGSGDCGMTDQLRQEALDAHNYLRRNVHPEAVGMARLSWSRELEALADKAARRCIFEHTSDREFQGKGENMYLGGKGNFTEILTMMFLERELYDFQNHKCLAGSAEYNGPYGFFSTCGHYLQIVRNDMTMVGCSINTCTSSDGSTNNLAVCEYESMYKEPPYRARKPNENPCELCGYEGYATDCDDGMCTVLDPENPKKSGVKRRCLNCGAMQSYGVYDFCLCADNFYGEVCESSVQSAVPSSFYASCDPCQQQGVTCLNEATAATGAGAGTGGRDASCECVCREGFAGKYCEVDITEEESTLHLYLGGSKRYYSYYPVDKAIWRSVGDSVVRELSSALSNYCTAGRPHVKLSSSYPATTINGSLRVGLHATCGQEQKHVPKSQLETALTYASKKIAATLSQSGLSVVAVD